MVVHWSTILQTIRMEGECGNGNGINIEFPRSFCNCLWFYYIFSCLFGIFIRHHHFLEGVIFMVDSFCNKWIWIL